MVRSKVYFFEFDDFCISQVYLEFEFYERYGIRDLLQGLDFV